MKNKNKRKKTRNPEAGKLRNPFFRKHRFVPKKQKEKPHESEWD